MKCCPSAKRVTRQVAPVRERGLKLLYTRSSFCPRLVAPVRERGLKSQQEYYQHHRIYVAPVRERGLKSQQEYYQHHRIYVAPVRERGLKSLCGIPSLCQAKRRSREGAWIEIMRCCLCVTLMSVAPVRERGLKSGGEEFIGRSYMSLP